MVTTNYYRIYQKKIVSLLDAHNEISFRRMPLLQHIGWMPNEFSLGLAVMSDKVKEKIRRHDETKVESLHRPLYILLRNEFKLKRAAERHQN